MGSVTVTATEDEKILFDVKRKDTVPKYLLHHQE